MSGGRPTTPTLDRSGEVWRATLPGLGSVEVHPDGTLRIDVEPVAASDGEHPEADEMRHRALEMGWGEPLALARRGVGLVAGAGLRAPDGDAALVVRGTPHDVATVLLELCQRGWSVLADRLLPLVVDPADIIAEPRSAPVLVGRRQARRAGLDAVSVRADTDAVVVEVARARTPVAVGGVVEVSARRPREPVLEVLDGHRRFEAAALLMVGGALADGELDTAAPANQMGQHLLLTQLPFARCCFSDDTLDVDIDALIGWWRVRARSEDPAR